MDSCNSSVIKRLQYTVENCWDWKYSTQTHRLKKFVVIDFFPTESLLCLLPQIAFLKFQKISFHWIGPQEFSVWELKCLYKNKNPAYGRHRISRPIRIVGPIQFSRVCVIYLEKKKKKKMGRLTRPRVHAYTHTRIHASTWRIHAGAMDALHPPPVFRAPRV